MSECWTFNVALLNLNLRRVHLRAVHAARARALPPGAQVEARKSQDCMMPEALLGPIVRTPAFSPNTLACAHETHELRHRSTLRDRQGAGTLCASASRPRWRALRPPRLHGPHAVMDRCEGRRRLREWIGWGAACSFMTSSINVSPSSRARARVPVGGDLPHGHAHRFRLDPMLSCPRESFVWVQGWHRGMRDRLVVACGRGGAPQPAVEELVGALENVVMTTSCVCALAASHNNGQG